MADEVMDLARSATTGKKAVDREEAELLAKWERGEIIGPMPMAPRLRKLAKMVGDREGK